MLKPVWSYRGLLALFLILLVVQALEAQPTSVSSELEVPLGVEVAVPHHLMDADLLNIGRHDLIRHGELLFQAVWTGQEGGGRPLTKGTGGPLADPNDPLLFPRNFNRLSAPDANSCFGCHNSPRSGGGGDIVANVFVLGQRFDHLTFDGVDTLPTHSSTDESGRFVDMGNVANSRNTLGMFGSGYIEMLARQMTTDLQLIRNALLPGQSGALMAKGVSFGTLTRNADGSWDTSAVAGLAAPSLNSSATSPPSLIIRPFHQAGAVVSLREFTNNAFNHHHGMQSAERFGDDTDPDGDGYVNEMTRADITAATIYQATLPPPGRIIPRNSTIEDAVLQGEARFVDIGCAGCHVPELPLDNWAWYYVEPNPFNPPGNLQSGEMEDVVLNLNSKSLPQPRLKARDGVTLVPAFTDLKLHDITSGPDDPNREPLNMHFPAGSDEFFAGNGRFLTRKLWGAANEPPYFHHGQFTTMRQAILAHAGEAQASTDAFLALSDYERDSIIEFLKTLVVLPEGAPSTILDERGRPRNWPPN